MTVVLLIAGLVLLVAGAELLVRGASRLARAAGVPALAIGLTVVAYGTSAPELSVSVGAARMGQADLALGNVVGSNVFNVLLILGLSALIAPLSVSGQLVRLDVPVMIGVSVLAWVLAADGFVGRREGMLLVAGLAVYTGLLIYLGKRRSAAGEAPCPAGGDPAGRKTGRPGARRLAASVILVAAGLALLVLGARWLVRGTADLARWFGVGELLVGLTIVAAGTSLPELATSVVASIRGERDIAVGNIVGSNIFNILGVLGASAAFSPGGVAVSPTALNFDVPVMVAVAIVCLPVFFTGGRICRWEGGLLLGYWVAYVAYLVLGASHHESLGAFSNAMLLFILPGTALGLGVSVIPTLRARKAART